MVNTLTENRDKESNLWEIDSQILDLKKEIADLYINNVKEKWTSLSFVIWEGKSIKKYLVSENAFDKIWSNVKWNFIGNVLSSVDPEMVDYLKMAKEKLDNTNTVDQLTSLKNELQAVQQPQASNTTPPIDNNVEKVSDENIVDNTWVPYKEAAIVSAWLIVWKDVVSALPKSDLKLTSSYWVDRWTHIHGWIDYWAKEGTSVYSMIGWEVKKVSYEKKWFWYYVVLKDSKWREIIYAHLKKKPDLRPWQEIAMWEKIWEVGNTWRSTGPHLHLEVRENWKSIDPSTVFPEAVLMA